MAVGKPLYTINWHEFSFVMCFITYECYWNTIPFTDQTISLFLKWIKKIYLLDLPLGPFCLSLLGASQCPSHQNISASPAIQNILGELGAFEKKKKTSVQKRFLRTYKWQRLVHLNRIQPPRAQALLSLLLLKLFHGLFDAYLGSAPYTLFKWLQLIVEGILVLLICCLWEDTHFLSWLR